MMTWSMACTGRPDGLLAATGNRGHIYRVQENGEFADIAHLEASQATGFATAPDGLYVGTSNGGKLFHLSAQSAEGSLESDVQDAGAVARWGRAEVDATGSGYQLSVRTGNVSNAERGWSAWKPVTARDRHRCAAGTLCAVEAHAEAGHQRACRFPELSAGQYCPDGG